MGFFCPIGALERPPSFCYAVLRGMSVEATGMDTPFDEIAADAMKLSLRDRVRLAQRLIPNLDNQIETGVEPLLGGGGRTAA